MTTPTLATPTCSVWATSTTAPATVSWSSTGSLSRSSAYSATGGYYSFTATISDGYNTNTNTCGMTINPPPVPGGVGAGSSARHAFGLAGSGGTGFGGIASIQVYVAPAAGATGYQSQYRYTTSLGTTAWMNGTAPNAGSWSTVRACIYPDGMAAYGPQARVWATNAYGGGPITTWSSMGTGAPALSCV